MDDYDLCAVGETTWHRDECLMWRNFADAVRNALSLYAELSGTTTDEVGQQFAASEECRKSIYLLVAMQASGSPYDHP